ncbi:MAG: hypothetical protein ABIA76_04340 [Candidatus Diapherotrites archaeon]
MSFLITRSEHDDSNYYLSEYSKEIIKTAEQKGIKVFDCNKENASKEKVSILLKTKNPEFVMFNGHGSEEIITGHKFEPIIRLEDSKLLENKIIYARACNTSKKLGKKCTENKKTAYIGYNKKFKLWMNNNYSHTPLKDPYAEPFLKTTNQIPITIIKGSTAQEAHEKGINAIEKEIEKLERTDAPKELQFLLPALYWNQQAQTIQGNRNKQIKSQTIKINISNPHFFQVQQ